MSNLSAQSIHRKLLFQDFHVSFADFKGRQLGFQGGNFTERKVPLKQLFVSRWLS